MFHVRHLHLGHLAKAFALREAPSDIKGVPSNTTRRKKGEKAKKSGGAVGTEERMYEVVRKQGKLTKKGGVAVASGAGEFQSISTTDLEKMAARFAKR
jgi:ATP-dependent RNA helicase DDX31/DBP7